MKKRMVFHIECLFLLVIFICTNIADANTGNFSSILGHWEGTVYLKNESQSFNEQLNLNLDFSINTSLNATLSFPIKDIWFLPLQNVVYEAPIIHFELEDGNSIDIFEGKMEKNIITGTMVKGSLKFAFILKRSSHKPQIGQSDSNFIMDNWRQYVTINKKQVVVEIPEVFELVNIAVAITNYGMKSSYLINKDSQYYHDVLVHFLPFKSHPLIKQIEFSDARLSDYIILRCSAFYYDLKNGHLVRKDFLPLSEARFFINKKLRLLLEDFVKKSHFEEFYQEHQTYYQKQIETYKNTVSVKKMWSWLENNFPARYDVYDVSFSPLIYGVHNTIFAESNEFKECIMFISGPQESTTDKVLEEVELSRIVFTEIDHNYVNPVTDQYINQVDNALRDLPKWHDTQKQLNMYGSPYMVINEYLTWVAYILYAYDTYDEKTFNVIKDGTIEQMQNTRGFIRFKDFTDFCLDLYTKRTPSVKVSDLYIQMIEWFDK